MNCNMPGFPVLHYPLEPAQTHVHWVDDATEPSHPLSPSSPTAFSLSQRQGFFQWVGSSHQVAKVRVLTSASFLPMNIQGWFPLELKLVWSPSYLRDPQESSPAPQFESINSLALSIIYGPTLIYVHDYWKNYNFHYMNLCQQSDISVMLSLICCLGLS